MLDTSLGAYLLLTLMALFLASNHVIGRSVQGVIPPLGLSFWRWMVCVLLLFPFMLPRMRRLMPFYRDHLATYLMLGCLMVGSTSLILVALNFTTAINTSLINAVQPSLTLLMAMLFINEKITRFAIFGIVSALTGVVMMLSKGSWAELSALQFNIGDIIALVAMLGFSGYALILKRLPPALSVAESLFAIALLGSLVLLPFYLLESLFFATVPVTRDTAVVVVELGLLVSLFANLMWNHGIKVIGPSKAAIFINLIPIFGAVLAVTFLDERIRFYHLAGALLICLGIGLVVGNLGKGSANNEG